METNLVRTDALRENAIYLYGFGKNKYIPLKCVDDAQKFKSPGVAEWVRNDKGEVRCSNCGALCAMCNNLEFELTISTEHFCYSCGAEMKNSHK